jgi:hypothetical protein
VLLLSKGSYFYDRPNSLLLVIEPVLFINLNICGRFWGKIEEFGQNRPKKKNTAQRRVYSRLSIIVHWKPFSLLGKGPLVNVAMAWGNFESSNLTTGSFEAFNFLNYNLFWRNNRYDLFAWCSSSRRTVFICKNNCNFGNQELQSFNFCFKPVRNFPPKLRP